MLSSLLVCLLCLLPIFDIVSSEQVHVLPHSKSEKHEAPELELDALQQDTFTRISQPAISRVSARIKKSRFCDGSVDAYTGYINAGTRHLFFYFFESRDDPSTDDVLLWTNGGPGVSSAMGLFMELGPCNIVGPNSTEYNPYSWNTNANIFFVDQPVGTGFSYSDFGETVDNAKDGAKDIAAFVVLFFETFSKFKGRPFHLTGESWAGRYLPIFAAEIYDQNTALESKGITPINLQSVVMGAVASFSWVHWGNADESSPKYGVGNGVTDFFAVMKSHYEIQCTRASIEPIQSVSACVQMRLALPRCTSMHQRACVDQFDIMNCEAAYQFCDEAMGSAFDELGLNPYDMTKPCDSEVGCYLEESFLQDFLNQNWVQDELGVNRRIVSNFSLWSDVVNGAFYASGDALYDVAPYVAELLERGVRVLVYAGTYDYSANWVGNEQWTLDMEWSGKASFSNTPLVDWTVEGHVTGKFRTHGGLTFATVYGAGHLVPHDKSKVASVMIRRWLQQDGL